MGGRVCSAAVSDADSGQSSGHPAKIRGDERLAKILIDSILLNSILQDSILGSF
jgi:hypothetical protein